MRFQPDGTHQQCTFIAKTDVACYFNCERDGDIRRVKGLVDAATRHSGNPHYDSVVRHCPRVFCILVNIGQQQFIPDFVSKNDLHDDNLPFGPRAFSAFPRLKGGTTFEEQFAEEQWRFCVEKLSYDFDPVDLHGHEILPIKHVKDIAEGASAIVRKIVVHADYDALRRTNSIPQPQNARASPLSPSTTSQAYILQPSGEANTYAMKSFYWREADLYFHSEVWAFKSANQEDKFVPQLVDFHKAFKQNKSCHIILQHANLGTLEDMFQTMDPPRSGQHILDLWTRIFELNKTVESIHDDFEG